MLQLVWDDTAEAIKSGLFDEREDRHLSRSVLCVDDQGWDELNDLLSQTLDRRCRSRRTAPPAPRRPTPTRFGVNIVIMSYPAPKSAKQSTAPSSGTRKKGGSSKKKTAAKA